MSYFRFIQSENSQSQIKEGKRVLGTAIVPTYVSAGGCIPGNLLDA